jgi:hypothetical protein
MQGICSGIFNRHKILISVVIALTAIIGIYAIVQNPGNYHRPNSWRHIEYSFGHRFKVWSAAIAGVKCRCCQRIRMPGQVHQAERRIKKKYQGAGRLRSGTGREENSLASSRPLGAYLPSIEDQGFCPAG